MNDKEYQHLKVQAQFAGMETAPFIRNLVAGVKFRPRPPDEYVALLRETVAIWHCILY
jgi:hypothetical protein